MSEIVAHCPKCESTDIREKSVAYAELRVTDWDMQGGGLCPQDYDADEGADWECENTPKPYVCYRCKWEGSLDELIVEVESDEDDVV